MSQLHTYISTQIGIISSSPYGNTIRTAIVNALTFIDNLLTTSGANNTFVVLTESEWQELPDTDKTATAYFIVEDDE